MFVGLPSRIAQRSTARSVFTRAGLIRQISSPVRWTEIVAQLVAQGVTTFVEVGPGKVLSGLVKAIYRDAALFNVEDVASLQKTIESLKNV